MSIYMMMMEILKTLQGERFVVIVVVVFADDQAGG